MEPESKPLRTFDDLAPVTVQGAIDAMEEVLTEPQRGVIMAPESHPLSVMATIGHTMQWSWGMLEADSLIMADMRESHGLGHPDEAAALILHGLWAKVRGGEFDVEAYAKERRDAWRVLGMDPKTGEKLTVTLD